MADIVAYKTFNGKNHKQVFSEKGWKGLGPDKSGWSLDPEQVVDNDAGKKQPKDQTINNDFVRKPDPETKSGEKKPEEKDSKVSEEKITEFMKHLEGFTKGVIKDHFDGLTPPVKYENTANLAMLKKQIGEHYKYDVVSLQKAFV